ncbi:hypothetical protein SeLEV6574_g01479 [Synchytrium endobioticum]|nr:hypothetical protein SeLEV6574_g01479 [Synchytrium endobioticum]
MQRTPSHERKPITTFLSLPNELILSMVAFIKYCATKARLGRCCKRLSFVILPTIYKVISCLDGDVYGRLHQPSVPAAIFQNLATIPWYMLEGVRSVLVKHGFPCIVKLLTTAPKIETLLALGGAHFRATDVIRICLNIRNTVKVLDIQYRDLEYVSWIIDGWPMLEDVTIVSWDCIKLPDDREIIGRDITAMPRILSRMPVLRDLKIHTCWDDSILSSPEPIFPASLRRLEIYKFEELDLHILAYHLQQTQLATLKLSDGLVSNGKKPDNVYSSAMPYLSELALIRVVAIGNPAEWLSSSCANLSYLLLSGCRGSQDTLLPLIFNPGTLRFKNLVVTDCTFAEPPNPFPSPARRKLVSNVYDSLRFLWWTPIHEELYMILPHLSNLEELKLEGGSGVIEERLCRLVARLPNLRGLELTRFAPLDGELTFNRIWAPPKLPLLDNLTLVLATCERSIFKGLKEFIRKRTGESAQSSNVAEFQHLLIQGCLQDRKVHLVMPRDLDILLRIKDCGGHEGHGDDEV